MYAHFESILEPMEKNSEGRVNMHVPSGFGVYSKSAYEDVPDPLKIIRGRDYVERFIDHVKAEAERLYSLFQSNP